MSNNIPVAEQFFSIQGEGPSAGCPAVFLRLAHCNLSCGVKREDLPEKDAPQEKYEELQSDDASWVCDTLSVWREPEGRYSPDELLSEWRERGFLHQVRNGAHIIITGGEPTLPLHQQALPPFLRKINDEVGRPHIEVETNGTMEPTPEFNQAVDQYNVSLKLSNSGMPEAERLNREPIEFYAEGAGDPYTQVKFKFVVGDEEDVDEIKEIIDRYDIPDQYISLMPAGATQEDLRETYPMVAELCKENGWYFSPRLHVDMWDMATGV